MRLVTYFACLGKNIDRYVTRKMIFLYVDPLMRDLIIAGNWLCIMYICYNDICAAIYGRQMSSR